MEIVSENKKRVSNIKSDPVATYFNLRYLLIGSVFGIIAVKSQIISWFRIQEMFRFESIFMYGIIGIAVITGMISVAIIKKFKLKTLDGEEIKLESKQFNKGQIYGGLIFGFGWSLTGACPGPIYALIGSGVPTVIITFLSALFGTWCYGYFKNKLPH